MNLVPWRPFRELPSFRDEFDRLFEDFWGRWPHWPLLAPEREWSPALDVSETKDKMLVKVELPGVDPKDIDLSVEGDLLTIKGERKQEKEEKEEDFHRIERFYGAFSRTLRLPASAEYDKVSASYKDGILKLTIPKKEEAKAKKIQIKS
jgi:HSP20 family protein